MLPLMTNNAAQTCPFSFHPVHLFLSLLVVVLLMSAVLGLQPDRTAFCRSKVRCESKKYLDHRTFEVRFSPQQRTFTEATGTSLGPTTDIDQITQ